MNAYRWVAYTASGQRRSGVLVAESERDASEQLQARGLFPSDIESRGTSAGERHGRKTRIDADTRTVFTRQMAVLLGSDLTTEAALDAVAQSNAGARLQAFVAELKAGVMEGYPLSRALERCGGGFERYYAAALRAGESSGDLATIFDRLAEYLETRGENRARLASALIYPGFVALVSLGMCGFLVTTVAPEIVSMLEAAGQPLPPVTRAVLGISAFLLGYWGVLLAALALLVAASVLALRRPALRDRWDRLRLRLPLVGRFLRLAASAQYLRTLALVLGSRQTVLDATRSATEVLSVARFRGEAAAVEAAIGSGESLSRALVRLTPLPPVARQLIAAGETSARLAVMADRAAVLVETWLNNERKRVAVILDPLLMVLVGGLVLTVVLAILLPIFDLQATIR